ncbi:MAG: ATP-binding protein, partial [Burkholderiales bacterium]
TIRAHPGRNGIRLEISDDGPGVKPEHRDQLFEPFFTTDDSNGSGLGLYIAREICAANRATLDYVDNNGLTTFRISGKEWE